MYYPHPLDFKNCIESVSLQDMHCSSRRVNDGTVSVYFTQYKRNNLLQQLKALLLSSVRIDEYLIYQGEQHVNNHSTLRQFPTCKQIWTTNWNNPFFLRF